MPNRVAVVVPGIMGSSLFYEEGSGRRTEIWGENFMSNYGRLLSNPTLLRWNGTNLITNPGAHGRRILGRKTGAWRCASIGKDRPRGCQGRRGRRPRLIAPIGRGRISEHAP